MSADAPATRRLRRRGFAALTIVVALAATTGAQPTKSGRVDGQAALHHIERLVALGPRPSGSAALDRTRDYIIAELRRAGIETRLRRFDARSEERRVGKECRL